MKSPFKILSKKLIIIIGMIMLANAAYFYIKYNATYAIKCEALVSHQAREDKFSYDTVVAMDLRNDATGTFSIEGTMRKGNDVWTLNRDVAFSYIRLPSNDIQLSKIQIYKYGRDNSPDEVFNTNFFNLANESSRTLSLAKIMNGYLVGTLRAPAFTCLQR